ncbi:TrkA family potassium uptake protein [candidate division NPL-UPA2 bacterium Unc8]|uniref:Trk system potassium uptake protein TrkA n=1 Tax=candidate division NPL-UPA2 bacterium Unc8 TaxID=1980939 RepID=A0A399FV48_UNCN2|nr:MAG: TrkA family potassium uptake protein [candidate division NPL-UPA2 bacterium Unc8]
MNIIIVGGGGIGYSLARALLANKHQVTIIEHQPERCKELVKELSATVIGDDGTGFHAFEDADAEDADVVIALTGQDEDNLIACQLANHHFQVPHTIARVRNPQNKELFKKLGGVTTVVCTTSIISSTIEEEVPTNDTITLLTLKEGASIIEKEIKENSPGRNRRVADILLPKKCAIVSIIRKDQAIYPHSETILEINDRVLLLVAPGKRELLKKVI